MATRTIVGLYEQQADASQVRQALIGIGIPESDITIARRDASVAEQTTAEPASSGGGFFDWLFGRGVPEEEARIYHEGIGAGGALVTVRTSEAQADRVIEVLDRFDPVDVEDRIRETESPRGSVPATSAVSEGRGGESETKVPVAEEELRVGKRVAETGRVRVRSYVTEIPVHEQVALRDEKVRVERRPAESGLPASEDAFKERSFEVTEHGEEPVVSKTPRVKEEVVISKEADTRTETVDDRIRRTEVEVDRAAAGSKPGSETQKIEGQPPGKPRT